LRRYRRPADLRRSVRIRAVLRIHPTYCVSEVALFFCRHRVPHSWAFRRCIHG
jgi:hypothetical protein